MQINLRSLLKTARFGKTHYKNVLEPTGGYDSSPFLLMDDVLYRLIVMGLLFFL